MELVEAITLVLELARGNLAPDDMPSERARQEEACNTLEDFAVNELGDA